MYPSGIAPQLLTQDLLRWPAALFFPIAVGVVIGIAFACLLGQPPWGDQALYLVAAGKVLDGARIGRDVVDVNPPLILWLSEVPVALARAVGILPQSAMQALIGVMTAGVLLWCLALVRPSGERYLAGPLPWAVAALLLYVTIIHPWYHIGTREHLLLLLVLPYLFLAARRLGGRSEAPRLQTMSAGLLAVAACGLKPQHLLTLAAVELLLLLRGGIHLRSLVRGETVAFVAGGIVYCAAIVIAAPDYVTLVIPFAYEGYLDRSRAAWVDLIEPIRLLKIGIAIALWFALRRISEHRALADVFMVAALGATVTYVMQRKGYGYQLVPALAFFHLALGMTVLGAIGPWLRRWFRQPVGPMAAAFALVAALIAGYMYLPGQLQRAATEWTDVRKTARSAIIPHIPAGSTVFMLSTAVGGIYDHLLRHDLQWGSRFTALWMTEALLKRELRTPRELALARWTVDSVVEDLDRYRPSVILVDRCDDVAFPPCLDLTGPQADLLGWFLRRPTFAAVWARYERRRQIGPYDVWCASDNTGPCEALLAAAPSR
jgi:hypothetical protein